MGKGKRLRSARSGNGPTDQVQQTAMTAWFAEERERLIDAPGLRCQMCGGPYFTMNAPLLFLRCNSCDLQTVIGVGRPDKPGSMRVFSEEVDGPIDTERQADGLLLVKLPSGDLRFGTTSAQRTVFESATGSLAYDVGGNLAWARGSMTIYAVGATRPPRCEDCRSPYTVWRSQFASKEPLLARATALGVPLYEVMCEGEPWWCIHGLGGRVFDCMACRTVGIVATIGPDDLPTPDGEGGYSRVA